MGIPTFDRLGANHLVSIGYRGTRDLVFAIGNVFMAEPREPNPDTWRGGTAHGGDTPVETHQLVEAGWR
jgi:nitrogenase molybdenum-iron protein NifN